MAAAMDPLGCSVGTLLALMSGHTPTRLTGWFPVVGWIREDSCSAEDEIKK